MIKTPILPALENPGSIDLRIKVQDIILPQPGFAILSLFIVPAYAGSAVAICPLLLP